MGQNDEGENKAEESEDCGIKSGDGGTEYWVST